MSEETHEPERIRSTGAQRLWSVQDTNGLSALRHEVPKCHYDDTEEMHQVIAQRLKETRQYTGEFVELFRYDKDGKIKMGEGILTLRFRYVVLIEDKTLVSLAELFGVVGFTCNFKV